MIPYFRLPEFLKSAEEALHERNADVCYINVKFWKIRFSLMYGPKNEETALVKLTLRLPKKLCSSLPWNRSYVMAGHWRSTLATEIRVSHFEPH